MASSSFSFETPSPSHPRDTRKRIRQVGAVDPPNDDAESKGRRSLRKRTRVDYTFEQLEYDENYGPKATPIANRSSKKRRSDHDDDLEKEAEARVKRRASEQPQPAPRRRGPTKRSTIGALPSYISASQIDDVEVQDTIEVGGHHSTPSKDSPQRRNSTPHMSSDSSQQNAAEDTVVVQRTPKKLTLPDKSQVDGLSERRLFKFGMDALEYKASESRRLAVEPAEDDVDPLEHLTPYIEGATTLYPTIQPEADPDPDPEPDVLQEDVAQQEEAAEDAVEAADVAEEETPAASPRLAETRANSPVPESDVIDFSHPPERKQYGYKQLRSASEFTDLFKDYKSLPPAELYRRLEVVNHALLSWQEEYNELRKTTDDEDNAQRYRQEDTAFLHRQKMAISKDPDANPIQKDFIVRGIRAQKPDPYISYAKQQDRIMANAYLFEYDDRESKIGQQDPIAQRTGVGKGRLRDRPKQTAKAAEADDTNVVHGKRTRKAPVLFDGGDATSRGSTPVPVTSSRRRRRGGQAVDESGDVQPAPPSSQPAPTPQSSQKSQSVEQETPKKKGKGGRPRKNQVPAPIPEDPPTPTAGPAAEPEPKAEAIVPGEKRTRKRRRKAHDDEEEPATNGKPEEVTPKPAAPRRRNSRMSEVPSGSFYTTSMTSTAAPEDSRPQTSSSTATVETVASNYQLREKRRTNFSSFNNGDDRAVEEEKTPRPKRIRRAPKKIQSDDFAPFHESMPNLVPSPIKPPTAAPAVQLPDPPAPIVPKPPPRIRIKTYHPPAPIPTPTPAPSSEPPSLPASSDATPPLSTNGNGNGADGDNSDAPKDYNTMTKSEKMSYSMKGEPRRTLDIPI